MNKDAMIQRILGSLRPKEEKKPLSPEERMLAILRKKQEADESEEPNIAPGGLKMPKKEEEGEIIDVEPEPDEEETKKLRASLLRRLKATK